MRAGAVSVILLSIASAALAQQAVHSPIDVTVDAQKTMAPVSKYEYGMFTEHIRDSMYRALWAEMLQDRKFYFPVNSAPDPAPRAAQTGGGPRGAAPRRWRSP